MKILVTETLSKEGLEILSQCGQVDIKTTLTPQELIEMIGDYEALVVRSQTKVTADVIKAG